MSASVLQGLNEGDAISAALCARDINLSETKTGKPYLRLRLGDSHHTVDAVMWNGAADAAARISKDDIVWVDGTCSSYQGTTQIEVKRIRPASPAEYDPADFVPSGPVDADSMWSEYLSIADSLESPWLSTLLLELAADTELMGAFRSAPGAVTMHHDYLGGLLEHSVSVARLCELCASRYPEVDRDLLLTGALLHDVGKLEEYRISTSISVTDEGQLIGHIVQGDAIVVRLAARIPGFPDGLLMRIRHIVVSHHGQLEWGSPKTPATREALIVHYMENLDAKMTAVRRAATGSSDGRWSAFDKATRRSYLIEPFEESAANGPAMNDSNAMSSAGAATSFGGPSGGLVSAAISSPTPVHSHQEVEDLLPLPVPDATAPSPEDAVADELSDQPSLGL